ncbi:MAG: methyltransferase [Candidatus Saccharibacteria bacterium]
MDLSKLRQDIILDTKLGGQSLTLATTYGLFSPKAIDEGTELLAKYLEVKPSDNCLDLGCGYGPLGLMLAKAAPNGITHLVDKDFVAIEYSNKNAASNGLTNASAFLSNGFDQINPEQKYDIIVSNIPAKIGDELLTLFLHDAYAHLNSGGKFYIVTISGLKDYMKRRLKEVFGNYDKLKQSKTYTAAVAIKN